VAGPLELIPGNRDGQMCCWMWGTICGCMGHCARAVSLWTRPTLDPGFRLFEDKPAVELARFLFPLLARWC